LSSVHGHTRFFILEKAEKNVEVGMPIDPSVIDVMLSAVGKDPENVALRLHLVSLLFDSGQMDEALKHCAVILTSQPDHTGALGYAARAAEVLGDSKRAEGYRRLLRALSVGDSVNREARPQDSEDGSDDTIWPADLTLNEREPESDGLP